jgi:hypothetical protein
VPIEFLDRFLVLACFCFEATIASTRSGARVSACSSSSFFSCFAVASTQALLADRGPRRPVLLFVLSVRAPACVRATSAVELLDRLPVLRTSSSVRMWRSGFEATIAMRSHTGVFTSSWYCSATTNALALIVVLLFCFEVCREKC